MTPREQQLCRDWDTRRDAWDKLAVGWHPVYDERATLLDCAASLVGTLGFGLGAALLLGLTTIDPVKVGLTVAALIVTCVSAYRQHPRLRDPLPARPQLDAETLSALGTRMSEEPSHRFPGQHFDMHGEAIDSGERRLRDGRGRTLTTREQAAATAHAERNPVEPPIDDLPF